jgi:flavin reductase (DIM6/NTAB) family NADH-FMN oxidoreductase RutF/DNA-binding transcriptional LysR family regulator
VADAGGLAAPGLRERFLAGMASAACTVNVVTTDGPAGRFGVTVSAMSSVSADTARPTLLVCVHHLSAAAQAIIDNGVFCVNVLRDDQSYISDCFAGRVKTPDGDKFSCTAWTTQTTGAPRVADPLVAFDCRLVSCQRVGTHYVLFGEAEDLFISAPGSPLIYANRAYGTPARHTTRSNRSVGAEMLGIGTLHTFGPYLIPTLLDRLAAQGHDLTLHLLEGDQRRVIDGLRAGEIEIALLYDFDLGDGLAAERLIDLQPYVLLAQNSPLAARAALSLRELAKEPLVLLDAPPSGSYFLSLFREVGLEPTVRIRTLSFEMVRGLVGHGLGYSLLATKPASAMSYDGRSLTTRPLSAETTPSRLVLVTRARGGLSQAAEAFRRACRGLFASQHAAHPDSRAFPDLEQIA